MKAYDQFGDLFKQLRISRGITLNQLSQKTEISSSDLSRFERGFSIPSIDSFIKINETLGLTDDEIKRLSIYAEYDNSGQLEKILSHTKEVIVTTPISDPVKELGFKIQDIKENIENLKLGLISENKDFSNNSSLIEEIEYLKKQVVELQASSQSLKAPIILPNEQEMELKLIPSTIFQRVEEYRQEQSKWSSWFGIFFGSILGILINAITGGTLKYEAWIVGVILILMSVLTGITAYQKGKRADGFVNNITK